MARREARSPLDMSVLDEMLDVPVGSSESISDEAGWEVGSRCHRSAICGIVGSEVKYHGNEIL